MGGGGGCGRKERVGLGVYGRRGANLLRQRIGGGYRARCGGGSMAGGCVCVCMCVVEEWDSVELFR